MKSFLDTVHFIHTGTGVSPIRLDRAEPLATKIDAHAVDFIEVRAQQSLASEATTS